MATYPVVTSEVISSPLYAGLRRIEISNPFQNRAPSRIIVGMVDPFGIRRFVQGEEYSYETLQLNRNNADGDHNGYNGHRFLQASGVLCKYGSYTVNAIRICNDL